MKIGGIYKAMEDRGWQYRIAPGDLFQVTSINGPNVFGMWISGKREGFIENWPAWFWTGNGGATRVDDVFVTGRFINIVEYPGEYSFRVKWFLPGSKYFSTESEAVSLILERYEV